MNRDELARLQHGAGLDLRRGPHYPSLLNSNTLFVTGQLFDYTHLMFRAPNKIGTRRGCLFGTVQSWVICSGSEGAEMARKQDRRVQRTQRLLREALISLIKEKGFEPLSVQEIIDRANVSRATFYAHFDNKEDLLVSGFDRLRAALKERQREALAHGSRTDERVFAFSHDMFAHVDKYRDVFRAMVGKRSGAMIQQLVHKLMVDLVRDEMKAMVSRGSTDSVPMEAQVHFIAGGFLC
jgi:AcrR family transcriptional regulator